MKKLTISILLVTCILVSYSCKKYLEVNPNRSGNDPISDVSQLDPLLNNINIIKASKQNWFSTIYASDDCEVRPRLYSLHSALGERTALNVWDKTTYTTAYPVSYDWVATWNFMFVFNTIIEYSGKVTGDEASKKKLKAEAMFYRAYFHFLALVQYSLHPSVENGETPGVGYRNSTNPVDDLSRKTVNYTMENIVKDLDEAERMLTELGKTDFVLKWNWRITVPTVHAFRARVELYKAKTPADFAKAAEYADKALAKYNVLVDIGTDPLFAVTNMPVTGKPISWKRLAITLNTKNTGDYAECYFPHTISKPSVYTNVLPVSASLYNLYNQKDQRLVKFIDNNYNYSSISNLPYPLVTNGLDTLDGKSFVKFDYGGIALLAGPTTPEMYLIKAENFARSGNAPQAEAILRALRAKRFLVADIAIANSIGGTLQDVKDERRRELPFSIRWYDLKRYNQIPGEQVTIIKSTYSSLNDVTSGLKTYKIIPTSGFYAMPIPEVERLLLNWDQNRYDGVE